MQKELTQPTTLTTHLISLQKEFPNATGDFTLLLTAIQSACKYISSKVRSSGVANLHGLAGTTNETGDDQKKLDVLSNDVFTNVLLTSGKCCVLASEEEDNAMIVETTEGKYVVAFDPLDGSSNIEVNISIGSIFSIMKKTDDEKPSTKDLLKNGDSIIAAGYCLYGSSTMMVLSIGNHQVNGYTLDPSFGEFILSHPNIKIPNKGNIYSINEGNCSIWEKWTADYVDSKKNPKEGKPYSLRYVGSMVADVHRTLIYGGIFLYPADKKSKSGKLRVLYECFPMSFVIEHAGGMSSTGFQRVLSIEPKGIHERCSIVCGSKEDVVEYEEYCKKNSS